jgi:hypothetical protein
LDKELKERGVVQFRGAAIAMADIEKLLLLDAIWTDLLVQEPPLDARQARVLRVLADDLVETLEAVSRSAPYIEEVVQSDPAGSYASFRKNLAQAQLDSYGSCRS